MRVSAQHLPISVARDEGDLFDQKTCFKKMVTTGAVLPGNRAELIGFDRTATKTR
jgi:hypothetical protein